jgi:hypothetical protein
MDDSQAVALLRAIREHSMLELASIRDAGTHGADSGFGGFTYTTDGADFTRANKELVWEILHEDADDFGYENVAAFVATFGRADMTDDPDSFDCLLAWYALERAGHWLNDRHYART